MAANRRQSYSQRDQFDRNHSLPAENVMPRRLIQMSALCAQQVSIIVGRYLRLDEHSVAYLSAEMRHSLSITCCVSNCSSRKLRRKTRPSKETEDRLHLEVILNANTCAGFIVVDGVIVPKYIPQNL